MVPYLSLMIILIALYIGGFILLRRERLSKFPGPWLASLTDLWSLWYAYVGKDKPPLLDLHDEYGDVVRLGPNKLSFGTHNAAKDILNVSTNLQKSEWYLVNAATKDGYLWNNFFSTQDTRYHDNIRKLINRPFSLAGTTSRDSKVAEVVDMFIRELRIRYADKQSPEGSFDLCRWCQNFTWDVLGLVTFSKPFGYLQAGSDILNLISDSSLFAIYVHYAGQAPLLDKLMGKNPLLLWLNRRGIANFFPPSVQALLNIQATRDKELKDEALPRDDMLDMWLQSKNANPDILTDEEVSKLLLGITFAGADTTATFITAILWYILKNPVVYAKLQEEIDKVQEFSYSRPANAPYLDAVIKETARIFPVVRFSLERLTPPGGMKIDGHSVPGNVKVSINPWVIGHDQAIWGKDHDSFNPDRWLVDNETYRTMTSKLYLFGMGKFQCIGYHIAYTEIYKVVPALLKSFEFEAANPRDDCKWGHGAVVMLQNVDVRIRSKETKQ